IAKLNALTARATASRSRPSKRTLPYGQRSLKQRPISSGAQRSKRLSEHAPTLPPRWPTFVHSTTVSSVRDFPYGSRLCAFVGGCPAYGDSARPVHARKQPPRSSGLAAESGHGTKSLR